MKQEETKKIVGALFFVLLASAGVILTLDLNRQNQEATEAIETVQEGEESPIEETEHEVNIIDESKLTLSVNEKTNSEDKIVYILKILNEGKTKDTLTYQSNQPYDYRIKDSRGDIVYHYLENQETTKEETQEELDIGVEKTHEIDITKVFTSLPEGNYTLEFNSTADQLESLATSITRSNYKENVLDRTHEEEIIFNSLQSEGNAFEGETDSGVYYTYFLESGVASFFNEELKKGTRIKITYHYVGGQRMVTAVEKVEK